MFKRQLQVMSVLLLLGLSAVVQGREAQAPDPSQFALETVASGFPRALYATHAGDGTGRLFLVQQSGQISVIEDGAALPTLFLDASSIISEDALGNGYTERGLLGLAFHPSYAENGRFFINYTERGTHDSIVAEYAVSDDANIADAASAVEMMRVPQPFGNHNGGHMAFGPDGYLYISLGDGGSAGDPLSNGQNPATLLGTILRVDVDSGTPYAIPADNPFVNDDSRADEIWSWGLRNVWRFSFDALTGDLYMGDVGQNRWEEINMQPASSPGGENYGWNALEATHPYSGAMPPTDAVMPVAEYQHVNGHCSVTGGYVYRGEMIPTLQGAYVYGDFCSGQLWTTTRTDAGWDTAPLTDTPYSIASFGEDEAGELYLLHYGTSQIAGQLLKFVPAE